MQNGVAHIVSMQNADGGFTSYIDTNCNDFKERNPTATTFNPSLILYALSYVHELQNHRLTKTLSSFVVKQRNTDYTYNYWTQGNTNRTKRYCPNDFDSTFCAYNALLSINPSLITTKILAIITKALIATEAKTGGPYRTWLVAQNSDEVWLDVDPAVNSNIAFFLSRVASIPKGLQTYLEEALANNDLVSPYYPTQLSTLYYLSRCPIKNTALSVDLLPTISDSSTSLERALTISVLLNIGQGAKCKPYVKRLLDDQRKDGSWTAAGFSIDRIEGSTPYYSGCSALTTAFALEALARYRDYISTTSLTTTQHSDSTLDYTFHFAETLSNTLPDELRATLKKYLQKLYKSDSGNEILTNAKLLDASLVEPASNSLLLSKLGSANLYGWIAYTIYDDFIDDEGDPRLLPAANVAHRASFKAFLDASPDKQFQSYVEETFNKIDAANAWEINNCRALITTRTIFIAALPSYKDLSLLADRSIGHALPPLAVLVQSGNPVSSENFTLLESALQHYLIAKQLNDDAHDWVEDFNRGHLSYVVTKILQEMCVPEGVYNKVELHNSMRHFFWHNTILTICDRIEHHILLGEAALRRISVFRSDGEIFLLFKQLKRVLAKTRKEREDTLAFLKFYSH